MTFLDTLGKIIYKQKKEVKMSKVLTQPDLATVSQEYNEFPKTFLKAKNKMVFVHKHGNLDNVKQGMDLILRVNCDEVVNSSVMKVKTNKKLPVGHCMIGVVGSKEIANAYIHESTNDYAIIGSMSSHSL